MFFLFAADGEDGAEPVSLYLDLEEGKVADMEVVAAAAIAFSRAVKEVAYVLDPSSQVRVELASGTPGSLSLNGLIRAARKIDKATLKAIAISVVTYFAFETRDFIFEKIMEAITDGNEKAPAEKRLSQEELNQIQVQVARVVDERIAASQVQQVYREVERDPAIRGVGASTQAGERPEMIVPRSQFAERAAHGEIRDVTVDRRVVPQSIRVVLISPVLLAGDRRWKFRSPYGDFGATIKDKEFLERVLAGRLEIPLAAGIELDVDLETTEERREDVWTPIERSVIKVHGVYPPPTQTDLLLPLG